MGTNHLGDLPQIQEVVSLSITNTELSSSKTNDSSGNNINEASPKNTELVQPLTSKSLSLLESVESGEKHFAKTLFKEHNDVDKESVSRLSSFLSERSERTSLVYKMRASRANSKVGSPPRNLALFQAGTKCTSHGLLQHVTSLAEKKKCKAVSVTADTKVVSTSTVPKAHSLPYNFAEAQWAAATKMLFKKPAPSLSNAA